MTSKISKRILIVESLEAHLYTDKSLKHMYDEIINISDYIKPLEEVESIVGTFGRIPASIYSETITSKSPSKLLIKPINKVKYVKIKELDLGENNAYFVVGKLPWYYLRDFHGCHIGLRTTQLDWQIVHLKPYSLGTNKFVFCHSFTDEHFSEHSKYFFDDDKLLKTVIPLKSSKVLQSYDDIDKALSWAEAQTPGTRFGLDYETNGLWRGDKYENLLVIGFGIATKNIGFYIELRYLSDIDLEKVNYRYKKFLDKHEKSIWVFNIDYEMMATRKFLGDWAIYEFKDADVWRILYGDQIGYSKKVVENKRYGQLKTSVETVNRDQRWTLKYTAQKYLSVPSWDDEFEDIETSLSIIFNGYKHKDLDDLLTNEILSPEWKKLVTKSYDNSSKILTLIKRQAKPIKGHNKEELTKELESLTPLDPRSNYDSSIQAFISKFFEYKPGGSYIKFKQTLQVEFDTILKRSYKAITSVIKKMSYSKKMSSWEYLESVIPNDVLSKLDKDNVSKTLFGCSSVNDVFTHPEWLKLISRYPDRESEFKELIKDTRLFGSPYAVQPSEIVGNYCILDSYYTVMIAETLYEKDDFKYKGGPGATWATTEKLVDIFNANKSLGGSLSLFGLYKDNAKRDNYNSVQSKVRIYCNYLLAVGFYKLTLSKTDLKPHPDEDILEPIFKTCLKYGLPPKDFHKVTKVLFDKVYDPNEDFGWSDSKAQALFGEGPAEELKEILLDHKPHGFVDGNTYTRSTSLHKDCGGIIENLWVEQSLPKTFSWDVCRDYYTKSGDLETFKSRLKSLQTFDIKGLSFEECMAKETYSYTSVDGQVKNINVDEMLKTLKSNYFDPATASEVNLGKLFEEWKDFRVLFTLINPKEFGGEINSAGIFDLNDSIEDKVIKFRAYIINIATNYSQPSFYNWKKAKEYAQLNRFTLELQNPVESDMNDPLQATAYMDKVLSHDVFSKYKVSKKLLDTYEWYMSIDGTMMKDEKEWMLKYKQASPLSYRDWFLDKGAMCKTYDYLLSNDYGSTNTENKLLKCDLPEEIDYSYYPLLTTAFKLYRKYDKLGQYLNGQLVDNDYKLIGEGTDGVPEIEPMTKEERHSSTYGNNVKMFPRYEIMQKSTKRNSSGIHTIPSSSEVKGVINAPEDSFLVYTDISSMELRGIAAIAKDQTMIDYFESGKDIKCMCPNRVTY